MDFSKMRKDDVILVAKKLAEEIKHLRKLINNKVNVKGGDKSYMAISDIKIDGKHCTVKVPFDFQDILEVIEAVPNKGYMSKSKSEEELSKIIYSDQEYNKSEEA